ncbi:hypothetical protein D3C81_1368280 [compost metagenome]
MQRFNVPVAPLQRAQVAGSAVLHEGDASVPLVQQVAARLHAHLVMEETDLQWRPFGAVIPDLHHGHVSLGQHLFSCWAVEMAGDHQCGRRPAKKGTHRALFLFFAEVAGRQQQLIAVTAEGVAEGLDGLGKDGPRDVRDHHADNPPPRRGQAAGHQVGDIAQRLHGGLDALAQRRRDLFGLVEVARHADRRNGCGARHVGQGDTACATTLAGGILGLAHTGCLLGKWRDVSANEVSAGK